MVSDFLRFILLAVTIIGLNGLWLTLNKNLYLSTFSQIQKAPVTLNVLGLFLAFAALIFGAYVTTGVGSNIQIPFINTIFPGLSTKVFTGRLMATMFLFGVAYLFWNGIALATFTDYTPRLAFMDILWGIALGGIAGYVGQL